MAVTSDRPALFVLRALGLGDFLTGLPALRGLSRAFPEHRRALAAPSELAALALHSGAVDAVENTGPLEALSESLHDADVAVNLHGRGPESHRVLRAARPRRVIAFGVGAPKWRPDEHEVARWCRMLGESGIATDPGDLDLEPPSDPPSDAVGATLIHPGAASEARRWPVERFAAVARAERADGRRVIVTGGPDEVERAQEVARLARSDGIHVYAGRTNLLDLAGLVAAAGRVVCGDTGVGHLATALRRPSVLLFGPTSPAGWGPPGDRPWNRVLWSGRRGDPHGTRPDAGLLRIQVSDVLAALG